MTPYPVRFLVPPSADSRNRLTVAFRPILAIPHMILIGPIWSPRGGGPGLLRRRRLLPGDRELVQRGVHGHAGARHPRVRLVLPAVASAGDGLSGDARRSVPAVHDMAYPTGIEVEAPAGPRDRLGIAFRAILAIPHVIALFFVLFAWCLISIVAWFAILFTGRYPTSSTPLPRVRCSGCCESKRICSCWLTSIRRSISRSTCIRLVAPTPRPRVPQLSAAAARIVRDGTSSRNFTKGRELFRVPDT